MPPNFDTVRAVACILLVSYHVVGFPPERGLQLPASSTWHWAMDSLDFIRMPTFTIFSGYLYGCRRVTSATLRTVWLKRLRRLGLPLIFCTSVILLLRSQFRDDERSLLFALTHSYEHLWFLQALLIIFTLVAVWDAIDRPSFKTLVVACAGASLLSTSGLVGSNLFSNASAIYLLPFFLLGIILRERPEVFGHRRSVLVAAAISVAILSYQQASFAGAVPELKRTDLPATLCGMSAAVVLIKAIPTSPALGVIGRHSYTIYLWHTVSAALAREWLLALGVSSIPLLFVLCLAAGLSFPILLAAIVSGRPWAAYLVTGSSGRPPCGPRLGSEAGMARREGAR